MTPITELSFKDKAYLFAQLSNSAYLLPCAAADAYKKLGFESYAIKNKDNQAFVLTNETDLVIACRGTVVTSWGNIKNDLEINLIPSSTGQGQVHQGFNYSVEHVWPELQALVSSYGKSKAVWCTGHSLGAAMSVLIAFKLLKSTSTVNPQAVFTYGQPRVGNREYVNDAKKQITLYRFVNANDIFTRVPTLLYKHYGDTVYMNHWGNIRNYTMWQITKDRWRGFVAGLRQGQINSIANHSIGKYCDNLLRWSHGVEVPQSGV